MLANLDELTPDIAKEVLTVLSFCDEEILNYIPDLIINKLNGLAAFSFKDYFLAEDKLLKDQNISEGYEGVDIGKRTIKLFSKEIKKAKTVIWNGPVGVFEKKEFAVGTYAIAKKLTKVKGTTIIGGGDSASAVINMNLADKMTHISTGGGASLKLFEGKILPGVDVIDNI